MADTLDDLVEHFDFSDIPLAEDFDALKKKLKDNRECFSRFDPVLLEYYVTRDFKFEFPEKNISLLKNTRLARHLASKYGSEDISFVLLEPDKYDYQIIQISHRDHTHGYIRTGEENFVQFLESLTDNEEYLYYIVNGFKADESPVQDYVDMNDIYHIAHTGTVLNYLKNNTSDETQTKILEDYQTEFIDKKKKIPFKELQSLEYLAVLLSKMSAPEKFNMLFTKIRPVYRDPEYYSFLYCSIYHVFDGRDPVMIKRILEQLNLDSLTNYTKIPEQTRRSAELARHTSAKHLNEFTYGGNNTEENAKKDPKKFAKKIFYHILTDVILGEKEQLNPPRTEIIDLMPTSKILLESMLNKGLSEEHNFKKIKYVLLSTISYISRKHLQSPCAQVTQEEIPSLINFFSQECVINAVNKKHAISPGSAYEMFHNNLELLVRADRIFQNHYENCEKPIYSKFFSALKQFNTQNHLTQKREFNLYAAERFLDVCETDAVRKAIQSDLCLGFFHDFLSDNFLELFESPVQVLIEKCKDTRGMDYKEFTELIINKADPLVLQAISNHEPSSERLEFIELFKDDIARSRKEPYTQKLCSILQSPHHISSKIAFIKKLDNSKFSSKGERLDHIHHVFEIVDYGIPEAITAYENGGQPALKDFIFRKIKERFLPDNSTNNITNENAVIKYTNLGGLIISSLKLLNDTDPNVTYLMENTLVKGSVDGFLRKDEQCSKVVQLLEKHGYDTSVYLSSGIELMRKKGKTQKTDPWDSSFRKLIGEILGSKNKSPEIHIPNISPKKLFHAIKHSYGLAMKGKPEAAIATLLTIEIQIEEAQLKTGSTRKLEDLHDRVMGLVGHIEARYETKSNEIYSRFWDRNVPEALYDNKRLSCCIFKPRGSMKQEIPLFVMDPQATMIEYWFTGYEEPSAVATICAGKQSIALMDTWEANSSIYSCLGVDHTKKFVLDSLVLGLDKAMRQTEHRKRIAIYHCTYGKPLEFYNYVKTLSKKSRSIDLVDRLYFEAVDPDDIALQNSKTEYKNHYTEAFRPKNRKNMQNIEYHQPMKGNIKACVIDIKEYIKEFLDPEK